MVDPDARRAGMISALIAIPVAVLAGVVVFLTLHNRVTTKASPEVSISAANADPSQIVTMAAPSLTPAEAQMCLAFIAQLPSTIQGLSQRHVSAGAEQNAAFGSPAITAACGVPAAIVKPGDQTWTLSNVCYHERPTADGGSVWETLDRKVPIAITIPKQYSPPGQWAIEFSDAIVSGVPQIATKYHCGS